MHVQKRHTDTYRNGDTYICTRVAITLSPCTLREQCTITCIKRGRHMGEAYTQAQRARGRHRSSCYTFPVPVHRKKYTETETPSCRDAHTCSEERDTHAMHRQRKSWTGV